MRGKFPADGGNNRLNLDDPKLSGLVDAAYAAPDGPDACAAWKDFNTYMIRTGSRCLGRIGHTVVRRRRAPSSSRSSGRRSIRRR